MDYSLRGYSNIRNQPNIDNYSQVSNTSAISLKPLDLSCQFHHDQPCNNYCIQTKCYQPLCSQCIEQHLLMHKKQGYSDLGVKSIRGIRKECVSKLSYIIEELIKRLNCLEEPPTPEELLEQTTTKLQEAKNEVFELIQQQFNRLRETIKIRIQQSTSVMKGMGDIHSRLQTIIEQLKQNQGILVQGKPTNVNISDCIRKTLTLDDQALLQTFENQGQLYEARRKKIDFDVIYNPQILKAAFSETVKIASLIPQTLNNSAVSYTKQKNSKSVYQQRDQTKGQILPTRTQLFSPANILHFFQTGSDKLHIITVQGRKKGIQRTIKLNEFTVPAFHASLLSNSGQNIYLSGGSIQLDKQVKSPLLIRINLETQTCKKQFARVKPRSSHTLCQDGQGDIYILGGYEQVKVSGGESVYSTIVERVNQKTGKMTVQASSNWGGSNIATACRGFILKACEQGVQLLNCKNRQWIIADVRVYPKEEYFFFKGAGHANLVDGQILVFGGYYHDLRPTDQCSYWKVQFQNGTIRVNISRLQCKLPCAEGFQNMQALIDEKGCFALQNIEDQDQQSCLDNERRLLRFDLKEGGGFWKQLQIKFEEGEEEE